MLWALLAFSIVGLTKYLTSIRLRALFERIQEDQEASHQIRARLEKAVSQETALRTQFEGLASRVTALRIVVDNLEQSCREPDKPPPEASDTEAH